MGLTKKPQDVAPKNNIISDGILISDFEDLTLWTQTGNGTVTADTTNFLSGTRGGKWTTTTLGSYMIAWAALNVDKVKSVSFAFYVPDLTTFSSLQCMLSSTTAFTNKFQFTRSTGVVQGWNQVKIMAEEFTQTGEVWGSIIALRLIVTAKTGVNTSVTFDNLRINVESRPKIMFRFSAALPGVYEKALPMLHKSGLKGHIDVLQSAVGVTGASLAQLLDMQNNYGWTMGGHGQSSAEFPTLTDNQIITEVTSCYNYMVVNGLTSAPNHMSYPGGSVTQHIAQLVAGISFIKSAMGSVVTTNPQTPQEQPISTGQAYEMWKLNFAYRPGPTDTFTTNFKPMLDIAIAHGGLFCMYMHGIADAPTGYDTKTTEFQALVNYVALLVAQGKIDVVSPLQWYDEYTLTTIPKNYYNWETQKNKGNKGFATVDIASIAAGGIATFTITVTGANVGDSVFLGAPSTIEAGLVWSGFVSAANTVTVRVLNTTTGAIDPASNTWMARVIN